MTKDNIPRVGKTVRGSETGQPIMVLFDLLSRRWAMGIIWQLHDGPLKFRELRVACDNVSPTVLNTRLKELRATNLVTHQSNGYMLTPNGQQLFDYLEPIGGFAKEWVHSY